MTDDKLQKELRHPDVERCVEWIQGLETPQTFTDELRDTIAGEVGEIGVEVGK